MTPPREARPVLPTFVPGPEEAAGLDPFLDWLLHKGGVTAFAYRAAVLQRRLPACLRQLRVPTTGAARDLLERRPELLPFALSAVLIGVSEFFRDHAVFDQLASHILPELVRRKGGGRVCSVGCSAGQELYSVAILLAEAGGLEKSEMLGVDCRPDAIVRASVGAFANDELDSVDPRRLARYFRAEGGRWIARTELRARMRWQAADLFAFEMGGAWDLILFRNVAIYLDDVYTARVWERLVSRLAPGGFLVAGKAETPPAALPLRRVAPCLFKRVS